MTTARPETDLPRLPEPTWRSPGAYDFDRTDFTDGVTPFGDTPVWMGYDPARHGGDDGAPLAPAPRRQEKARWPLSVWAIVAIYSVSVLVGALMLTGHFR